MENQAHESQASKLQVVTPTELEAMTRAEVDVQIATAHRYPRQSLSAVKKELISFATLDQETAESCFYVLRRKSRDGEKEIRGPSARLAEMAAHAFGNLSAGAREIGNDGKNVTIQAIAHDLEKNVRISIEVKRKITDRNGHTFSEDMQTVTSNAAKSIALRNAFFKVIPMALIKPAYEAARATAVGDAKTLVERRTRAVETFTKMGVSKERLLAAVDKENVDDIDLAALETLLGLHTAIKDGDTSIDEAFPAPAAKKPIFQTKPGNEAASAGPDKPAAVDSASNGPAAAASQSSANPGQQTAGEGAKPEDASQDTRAALIKTIRDDQAANGWADAELYAAMKTLKLVGKSAPELEDMGEPVLNNVVTQLPSLLKAIEAARGTSK